MKMKVVKWTLVLLGIIMLAGTVYYFLPEGKLLSGKKIDKLVVIKSERMMKAYSEGHLIRTYKISLGRNPVGDKAFEGDKRTPEGEYFINDKNPHSRYYKNLGISYPDKRDIDEAKRENLKPGGEIKIHGIRNGFGFIGKFHRMFNWTAGCIALTNEEMHELYESVDIGTPIIIKP